jgi:hypothetical protein
VIAGVGDRGIAGVGVSGSWNHWRRVCGWVGGWMGVLVGGRRDRGDGGLGGCGIAGARVSVDRGIAGVGVSGIVGWGFDFAAG